MGKSDILFITDLDGVGRGSDSIEIAFNSIPPGDGRHKRRFPPTAFLIAHKIKFLLSAILHGDKPAVQPMRFMAVDPDNVSVFGSLIEHKIIILWTYPTFPLLYLKPREIIT
jgi:hypothetical protein